MSEKRKPVFTFMLKNHGKRKSNKVELFPAHLWRPWKKQYRMRVNGKWFPKGEMKFFYFTEIRDILWRSIKI